MIKKLLLLFVLTFSLQMLAQPAIETPPDLVAACGQTFDLTSQDAAILNGQDPAIFEIHYHETLQDATNVFNQIPNPSSYAGYSGQVIYVSVQELTDEVGYIGITSFSLIVEDAPLFPPLPDVTACDFYELPSVPEGLEYFLEPGGVQPVPVGYFCTFNQIIYVRGEGSGCAAEQSFLVTILETPPAAQLTDVSACDSYELPALPPQYSYWTGPNGTGTEIPFGTVITSSMEIHVFGQMGLCTSNASFIVTITDTAVLPVVSDVVACGSYVLPALPAGQSYHDAPGGNSPIGFLIVEQTMVVYIFSESGTIPNCTSESSFTVTINEGTSMDPIEDVVSCHSYVLPELPSNGSYSFNDVPLSGTEPFVLTQSGIVTLEVPGFCPENFIVMIHDVTPESVQAIEGCDPDGDGFGTFDLELIATGVPELDLFAVSFFETEIDAQNNTNQLQWDNYTNVIPNSQTIYVRISNSPDCYTVTPVSLVTVQCNTITGTILVDTDNDGCSDADLPLANQQVILSSGNGETYAYTNADGVYAFHNVPAGASMVQVGALTSMLSMTPLFHEINVEGEGATFTADFCATPVPQITDVEITVTPSQAPRPGFASAYYLTITNAGTIPASGTATYNFDPSMVTFTSTWPTFLSQTSNSVTLEYTDLAPSSHSTFYIYQTVLPPPTVEAGDQLVSSATVTVNGTDINPDNNIVNLNETVVNSYDPNDITCHEGEYISEEQADGFLHYTIRFQNTGTADAVNIRLENTLDEDLDWSTFQPITGSHTYQIERHEEQLTFRFNDINLSGSQEDEPGSHGYVTYKIRPVSGFEIGDLIENTAEIYFDFNLPIITNTYTTQIQQLSVNENQIAHFKIYPNPAAELLNVRAINETDIKIQIVDLQGKVVVNVATDISGGTASINISQLASGMYMVRIASDQAVEVKKLIVN